MLQMCFRRIAFHGRMFFFLWDVLCTLLNQSSAALDPEHCDTIYPYEPVDPNGETGYFTLRFELSQISTE